MFSVAGKVFDILDDGSYKIAMAHKEELKGCSLPDPEKLEKLSDNQFALVMKTASGNKVRKYPINDENNTKVSSVYFKHIKNDLPKEIVKVAQDGFEKKANEIDLATVKVDVPVLKWRDYPLNNSENVKTAIEKFAYTSQRMNPREKYAYARAIVKEARVYNVEPVGEVLSYSANEINPISVKTGCAIRKTHVFDSDMRITLDKIAKAPSPEKFIEFDKIANLTSYVADGKIPDGYATCYTMIKVAKKHKAEAIPLQTIEKLFDPEFAKEWAKNPIAIYNSLPEPTQSMIDKQASLGGVLAATTAMLATERIGENRGAQKVIDMQMEAKGWVLGKKCLYEKNEEKIVKSGGEFVVVDKDGAPRLAAQSLTKLVMMV